MSKVEKAVKWMLQTAEDPAHGYDQRFRWGEKGDYDCASAIITAYESVGIPVHSKGGATYCGNMYSGFKRCGFKDITKKVNLSTHTGLKAGDVLLNPQHHTAMYIGNGNVCQASINERGGVTGGKPGDQTGREFYIRPYYNFPWTYVLRYKGKTSKKRKNPTGKKTNEEIAVEVLRGEWGTGATRRQRLKKAGYDYAAIQKIVNNKLTK